MSADTEARGSTQPRPPHPRPPPPCLAPPRPLDDPGDRPHLPARQDVAPDERRHRGQGLHAATAAAPAREPTLGDPDVPDLPGGTVAADQRAAAEDDRAAYPLAEHGVEEVLAAPSRAQERLAQGRGPGVLEEHGGKLEPLLQE